MFETLEIMLLLDQPAVVLKRELADLPLWGWVVRRYGVIPVDRAGGAAALRRMMRSAEAAIAEGRPIVDLPRRARGSRPASSRRSSRALPASTGRWACRWCRSRSTAAGSGRATASSSGRGSSPSASASRSRPACRAREIEAAVHQAINVLEAGPVTP